MKAKNLFHINVTHDLNNLLGHSLMLVRGVRLILNTHTSNDSAILFMP